MKILPKLRCPVCGMIVWLRNLLGFHHPDAYKYTFGIGRGKIKVEKSPIQGDIYSYWIRRLKEVIEYLENERQKIHPTVEIPVKPTLEIPVKPSWNVSEISVLPQTELKLKSTPSVILNVPRQSLSISTKKKVTM